MWSHSLQHGVERRRDPVWQWRTGRETSGRKLTQRSERRQELRTGPGDRARLRRMADLAAELSRVMPPVVDGVAADVKLAEGLATLAQDLESWPPCDGTARRTYTGVFAGFRDESGVENEL